MTNVNDIKKDKIKAMKLKDKNQVAILNLLISTMENEKIKLGRELTEDDNITCINRQLKAVKEEIDIFSKAGRDVEDKIKQREILISYLPKQLTEEEINDAVGKAVASSANMKEAMQQLSVLKGKADMGIVSKLTAAAMKAKGGK